MQSITTLKPKKLSEIRFTEKMHVRFYRNVEEQTGRETRWSSLSKTYLKPEKYFLICSAKVQALIKNYIKSRIDNTDNVHQLRMSIIFVTIQKCFNMEDIWR